MNHHERTPAEIMLPAAWIEERAEGGHQFSEEAATNALFVINTEVSLMKQGVAREDLALASTLDKFIESRYESLTDPLTGLLNREGMELWYDRYCPGVFGVIFADGRNFKRVNDTYGHDTGDEVIRTIGEKISSKFRIGQPSEEQKERRRNPESRDAMGIVRWSGDEFMMIVSLDDVPEEERQAVLQMLQKKLKHFGSISDADTGDTIDIQIDSAATIGFKKDGKSLKDYRVMLDHEVNELKHLRGRTR